MTRKQINKSTFPTFISISSVSELDKYYQMCQEGLQRCCIEVAANIDESDQMIETIINSLKLSQTKVT